MAWAFTWGFWLTVAAGAVGLALIVPVLRARIRSPAVRWFLALLMLEGVNFATDGGAWLALDRVPRLEAGLHGLAIWTSVLLAPAYLLFIRAAVDARTTRWLHTPAGTWAVWVFAAASAGFITGVAFSVLPPVSWFVSLPLRVLNLGVYVFAIVVAIDSLAAADTESERRRGVALLLAFGLRDIAWLFNGLGAFDAWYAQRGAFETGLPLLYAIYGVIGLVYFPAVTYAVLSGRIVDVDRRFQVGLSGTTAAAVVATLFVVVNETVESLLPIDNTVVAVAAAVALAFLFQPIQKGSERVVSRLFPGDDDDHAFFASQCQIAWRDGRVSQKEREMLEQLAQRLGLDARVARSIEAPFRKSP